MVGLTLVTQKGERHNIEANEGQSLLFAANAYSIDGLTATCGGNVSCATCHVYIEATRCDDVAPPSDDELAMIDCANSPLANSRLACQVKITDMMENIEIRIGENPN